ncbi:MAG: hypothetical protein U5L07_07730 [Desulfobacterales bacterium]|nr:hypothetical protein [Desulfobacterales bacterium]
MIACQDCEHCKTVVLAPENRRAVDVIEAADPIMWRAGGAVDARAIELACAENCVDDIEKPGILAKVRVWIAAVREDMKTKGS